MNTWEKLWQNIWDSGLSVVRWLIKPCVFCLRCEQDGEPLKSIGRYSGYGETKSYRYHEGCLQGVVADPEAHGHKAVDLALDILNCKELKKQREEHVAKWRARKRQQIRDFRDQRLP